MFKMLVGISLVSLVAELFISGTKNQKYIRAIIGVFSFIILLQNVFSIDFSIDFSIIDKTERIADFTISEAEKKIVETYEKNIKTELESNLIEVNYIKARCDGNLTVKKVIIILGDLSETEAALSVLEEKFGLGKEIVELKGEE